MGNPSSQPWARPCIAAGTRAHRGWFPGCVAKTKLDQIEASEHVCHCMYLVRRDRSIAYLDPSLSVFHLCVLSFADVCVLSPFRVCPLCESMVKSVSNTIARCTRDAASIFRACDKLHVLVNSILAGKGQDGTLSCVRIGDPGPSIRGSILLEVEVSKILMYSATYGWRPHAYGAWCSRATSSPSAHAFCVPRLAGSMDDVTTLPVVLGSFPWAILGGVSSFKYQVFCKGF